MATHSSPLPSAPTAHPYASAAPSTPPLPAEGSAHPLLNRLLAAGWRRGVLPEPTLDPDALLAAAQRRTGLSDAGDPAHWRPRLERLCAGLATTARLNPLGRAMAHGQLVGILVQRLRAHALWRAEPAIADVPLPAPLVIVGQMRSGSTRLQRLLACDPQLAFTRFFESWQPLPGPVLLGRDARLLSSRALLAVAKRLNPDFALHHPTGVAEPDEELGFHAFSLHGSVFEAAARLPDFARWCEAADADAVYAEFRRLLQTVAWTRRCHGADTRPRPWIIKVPQLTQDLPALVRHFPDARLIFIDRDPAAMVASAASLVSSQMRVQSDEVDRPWVGREWLRKVALRRARIDAFRARHDGPHFDIAFDAMNRDWQTQMRRLYDGLGLRLGEAARQRMAAYLAASARLGLDRHRPDLAQFGLTPADVAAAMAFSPERMREHSGSAGTQLKE